jgi:hypothetical protein
VFISTQRGRSSALFILYIAKQVQVGCAECFRRHAEFKRITNVRYKVLQITLFIRDSSSMLFFTISTTAKHLEYLSVITQLNYAYAVHERNARIFVCVTKPASQPIDQPTNQPTDQSNKQSYQAESYMGRNRHSTNEGNRRNRWFITVFKIRSKLKHILKHLSLLS